MKRTHVLKIALITVAVAMVANVRDVGVAGQVSAAKDLVPVVINLHAPNNATSEVTVWIPKATSPSTKPSKITKKRAEKVISLPASNSGLRSVTVWTDEGRN
jgi:hypothetical protein